MSKKITIANPEVLSNGTGDPLRDYFYKWTVNNGQIEYLQDEDFIRSGIYERLLLTVNVPMDIADESGYYNVADRIIGDRFLHKYPDLGEVSVGYISAMTTSNYRSFGTKSEKLEIRPPDAGQGGTNPDNAQSEPFRDLVGPQGSLITNMVHSDFVTIATTQPIIQETLNSQFDNPSDQQGVSFHYNYFDREYEEELTKVNEHYFIPNIYETTNIDDERESENLFKTPLVDKLKANLLDSTTSLSTQNQLVPPENSTEFASTAGYSSFFPMKAEIVVSSGQDSGTEMAQAFGTFAQGINFTRDLEGVAPPSVSAALKNENITISTDYVDSDGINIITSDDIDNVKTVNLAEWIDQDAPGWYGEHPIPDNFSFIGPVSTKAIAQPAQNSAILSEFGIPALTGINVNTFYDRLKDLADTHGRAFYQILRGDPAYSETLMYKVEKFVGPIDSITTSDPIQSFHFMNLTELVDYYKEEDQQRHIKFVDTQVKYGQDYSYVVTAYQAIVGSHYRYEYEGPILRDVGVDGYLYRVNIETVIKVVEIPLYASSGKVLDLAPLPPQVDFKPIQGSANKIRISFDMSLGSQDLEPISLNSQEQTTFDQMAVNQNRADGLLTFGSDNAPTAYEVFKLDTPPVKIEDFDGNRIATISTLSSDGKTKRQASSATYIARQPINQKCYYMFRSVDFHGGLSNPSTVYEVELYGDTGVTFPIIREYQFGQISPKMDSKSARKIIQIVPRFTQAYLNQDASGLIDPATGEVKAAMGSRVYLGVEDEPLFGRGDKPRKFKIRITSKTTGKKVDLNVSFKTKEVKAQTQ